MGWAAAPGRFWGSVPGGLCQGAPMPRAKGSPGFASPGLAFAEICRCEDPWEVRKARCFPKSARGRVCPALTWLQGSAGGCGRARGVSSSMSHLAGSVSPLAVLSEAEEEQRKAVLGRSCPPSSSHSRCVRGAPRAGMRWPKPPAAQCAAHEQFQLQSHAQS